MGYNWDLEIECQDMADCFGQSSPYTMTIFSEYRRNGRELYGRFDFGEFEGVFRFSTQREAQGHRHKRYDNDIDEFLLDAGDMPSAEDPKRYYCWREKSTGKDVIELRSDSHLYKMTFFDSGRRVKGTWDTQDSDPGDVRFQGVKTEDLSPYERCNIQREWDGLDQAAYDKANKDRWRRRY
jgi:hypothetical protein